MEFSKILFSVVSIWAIAVITPGPNFFLTMQTAMSTSRRAALSNVLGICTGTILWSLSGFFGLTAVFRLAPCTYFFLKFFGGSYLVYLGIQRIRSSVRQDTHTAPLFSERTASLKQNFRRGLLTNLSNPKTAMFITSLFAATMPSHASPIIGMMSVTLIFSISFLWYTLVAYVFSLSQFRDIYRKIGLWLERCAGVLFIGFGMKLATSK